MGNNYSEINAFKEEYEKLFQFLKYSVHELPSGVLFTANGATEKECIELMSDLNKFEKICNALKIDNSGFIQGCRWHFERYPHYLSRQRHFGSYPDYIERYNGPERV